MARGWESKAVSDQIEEGKERPAERPANLPGSPEARLQRQQLESLRLSRSRTVDQLQGAANPAYRAVLQKGLRALEEQIEQIGRLPDKGTTD
jgi:hypothetical protein